MTSNTVISRLKKSSESAWHIETRGRHGPIGSYESFEPRGLEELELLLAFESPTADERKPSDSKPRIWLEGISKLDDADAARRSLAVLLRSRSEEEPINVDLVPLSVFDDEALLSEFRRAADSVHQLVKEKTLFALLKRGHMTVSELAANFRVTESPSSAARLESEVELVASTLRHAHPTFLSSGEIARRTGIPPESVLGIVSEPGSPARRPWGRPHADLYTLRDALVSARERLDLVRIFVSKRPT